MDRQTMPEAGKSILVAEDEPDIRLMVAEALGQAGFNVIEAESGLEALSILQSNPGIALLFTDIMMPGGMDGFELAHRAKQFRPDLQVIYTTGYAREVPWGRHGIGYGPMLAKPYRNQNLMAEVKRALASSSPTRNIQPGRPD